MRHYSTAMMIERLSGLLGTKDLTEWETNFVQSLKIQIAERNASSLSERQVERLDELHSKHFA
jgi:hypothetical protein